MKLVFADTAYWIAIFRPGDPWQLAALQANETTQSARLVTTDEVLTKFLAALSGAASPVRLRAARFVRGILSDPEIQVIPQSRDSFLTGLQFYEARPDKRYSLTDCISMATMRALSIGAAFTGDHHFQQEGFEILMKRGG